MSTVQHRLCTTTDQDLIGKQSNDLKSPLLTTETCRPGLQGDCLWRCPRFTLLDHPHWIGADTLFPFASNPARDQLLLIQEDRTL